MNGARRCPTIRPVVVDTMTYAANVQSPGRLIAGRRIMFIRGDAGMLR